MEAERLTKHITRIDLPDGIRLALTPTKEWTLLFLVLWLVGWSTMPMSMLTTTYRHLFMQRQFDWFSLLWSTGWAAGLVAVGWQITWKLAGSELLELSLSDIELTKKLFGFTLRSRKALLTTVKNLRYVPPGMGKRQHIESRIRYEDSAGTVEFGSGLPEVEALTVIEQMLTRYSFTKRDRALEYVDPAG